MSVCVLTQLLRAAVLQSSDSLFCGEPFMEAGMSQSDPGRVDH